MKHNHVTKTLYISCALLIAAALSIILLINHMGTKDPTRISGSGITVVSGSTDVAHPTSGRPEVDNANAAAPVQNPAPNVTGIDARQFAPDPAIESALDRDIKEDIVASRQRMLERQTISAGTLVDANNPVEAP